jgi:hypothetical protein
MSSEDKEFVGELRKIPLTTIELSKYLGTSRQALYQGIGRKKRYFTIEKLRRLRSNIENDPDILDIFEKNANECFRDIDIIFNGHADSADSTSQKKSPAGRFWVFVKNFHDLAIHRRELFENIVNKMMYSGNEVIFFTCNEKYQLDHLKLQKIVDIYYLSDFDSMHRIQSKVKWITSASAVAYMPLTIIYFTSKGPRAAVGLEDRFVDLPESDTRELAYAWRLFYEANPPEEASLPGNANAPMVIVGNGPRRQSTQNA